MLCTTPSPQNIRLPSNHLAMGGFSLTESLVALSLMAIISSYALISTPAWVNSRQAGTVINDLRSMINLSRHAAIVLGKNVIVCPLAVNECGARNTWHNGVVAFADNDGDRNFSTADTWLAQSPPLKHGHIVWRAFRSRSYLMFTPRGITDWQNGHLLYCPNNDEVQFARQLVLNVAGRTYSSRDRDGDGVHEDVRGRPLQCS